MLGSLCPGVTLSLLGTHLRWALPCTPKSLPGTSALQLKSEVVKISPVSLKAEKYFRSLNTKVCSKSHLLTRLCLFLANNIRGCIIAGYQFTLSYILH